MLQTMKCHRIACAVISTMVLCGGVAKAETSSDNSLTVGYARILFNSSSSDLTGPPGTTPPGATLGTKDTGTFAFIYDRKLVGPVSLVFQMGTPPVVHFIAGGSAAPLGEIGTTRAWFPAVLAKYSFSLPRVTPYVAGGLNYTWFTDTELHSNYTAAFGGTSTTGKLSSNVGPVLKIGATIPLASRWTMDLCYSRYWIDTSATVDTVTPGLGVVSRTVDLTADPDVFALTVGFSF